MLYGNCCFVNAVPSTPTPDVCAVYDKENGILLAIQNTWDEVVYIESSQCTLFLTFVH